MGAAKSTTAKEGEAPDEFPLVAGEEEKGHNVPIYVFENHEIVLPVMHEARHVCDGDNHPEQNKVRWSVRNSLFFLSFDSIFVHN